MDETDKFTSEKKKQTIFKEFIKAGVSDPLVIHPENECSYAVYNVYIMTNSLSFTIPHSLVRRRYSEFAWLRKRLCRIPCVCNPPSLPMKSHWWNFDSEFLERRSRQLETFIVNALHLFLQSELTTQEMLESIKKGRVNEAILNSRCAVSSRHIRILSCCENNLEKNCFTAVVWKVECESLKKIESIHSSSDEKEEVTFEKDSQVKAIDIIDGNHPYPFDHRDKLSSESYSPWFEFWKLLNEATKASASRN